jgi:hypothetical protein
MPMSRSRRSAPSSMLHAPVFLDQEIFGATAARQEGTSFLIMDSGRAY